jgi:phosphohistidine phosphatase
MSGAWHRTCPYPGDVRLYIVRHAEAAQGDPDELRPLTPIGREQARDLGKHLAADGVRPDVILSSPLLRARETADEIARATGAPVEPAEQLAPGATADGVRTAIAGRGERVLIVGHQPDCGQITADLGGDPGGGFPPAGIRAVELPS